MRRKYLALAYIAVFETILSWDKWDGAIEMIMVTLMFWVRQFFTCSFRVG